MNVAEIPGSVSSPHAISTSFRRLQAIQAYSNENSHSERNIEYRKQIAMDAIGKWLNAGDVRIEFYSSQKDGGIRVKVVADDKIELCKDMSLNEFLCMRPVKI